MKFQANPSGAHGVCPQERFPGGLPKLLVRYPRAVANFFFETDCVEALETLASTFKVLKEKLLQISEGRWRPAPERTHGRECVLLLGQLRPPISNPQDASDMKLFGLGFEVCAMASWSNPYTAWEPCTARSKSKS